MSGVRTTLTKNVRVWEDVHALYKELSEDLRVVMGDLISSALLELLLSNPHFLAHVVAVWFERSYTRAFKVVERYQERAQEIIERYVEAVKAEEEA